MTLDLSSQAEFATFQIGARKPDFLSTDGIAADWVARGFAWFYAFNLEAAVHCFRAAVDEDDSSVMGWWGVAFASGPFMNMPWDWFTPAEKAEAVVTCHDAAFRALAVAKNGTREEQALVNALVQRYPSPEVPAYEADFADWDRAYADAMKSVYSEFGTDPDIAAIFVDSQIMITPWAIWDVDARAPNPAARVDAIYAALANALSEEGVGRNHLGLLHYDIHVQEMSPMPEQALTSAQRLGQLAPAAAGHLRHMPAHIHSLEGDLAAATDCSHKAVTANQLFKPFLGCTPFYRTSLCHDAHMLMYAGMLTGNYSDAIAGVAEMRDVLDGVIVSRPDTHLKMTLEGYHSTLLHVPIRFGRWHEVVTSKFDGDPDHLPVSWAMYHYAQAVALAALGQVDAARQAASEFAEARRAVPAVHGFFNNPADDTLAVAESMMKGELAYHEARFDEAFDWLEQAALREDRLYYNEPRAWMHPPRHALGALLLEKGHVERAKSVYRRDLGHDDALPRSRQNRNNIWSLHGLAECLERLNHPEAVEACAARDAALALSDQKITSSCFCRRSCTTC